MQESGIFSNTKNLPNSSIAMQCLEDFYIQFKAKIALNVVLLNNQGVKVFLLSKMHHYPLKIHFFLEGEFYKIITYFY